MSTLFLSGIQLWQTFHVYFSVAPGLAWIPSAWWSRGLGLDYSYDLFSYHHFMGSICWWLWRWSLVRYHNFLLEWRWSMFIWWESLWPRDNMKSSYRWMAIQIHERWLSWTMGVESKNIGVDILDIFLKGNAPQSIFCAVPTEHFLLWDHDFGYFSIINVNALFIQYCNIICIYKLYSTKQRIVHYWH